MKLPLLLCIFFLAIHCQSSQSKELQCSVTVVNRLSASQLQFQRYHVDSQKVIKEVTLANDVSTIFLADDSNNQLLFQSDQTTFKTVQRISLSNLQPVSPDYYIQGRYPFNFNRLVNVLFTTDRSIVMDGVNIFSIQQTNASMLSIKPICKSSTSEILAGSIALRGDVLYYTSVKQFGIVAQNFTTCELNQVAVLHDHNSSSLMIPTNLFVYKNYLYATLHRDQGEDHGIIAKIDMVAQDYREATDLTRVFQSEGKVAQRMAYLDSKNGVLSGWFASADGSRSVLFLYDVEKEQVMSAINFQTQGELKAITSQCQPK